ncbi:hypothetical protein B0H13DRAFT_1614099 [Mycena leptocephala]|nr:hypothetical protein B0H13DRAFT_1614099 [Mycena leptocephala]
MSSAQTGLQGHPFFPAELERLICETAALLHPRSMHALILVARRFKIWIEPLLYKVLTICGTGGKGSFFPRHTAHTLASLLEARPASFFHRHVRSICFTPYQSSEYAVSVLSVRGATINVAFLDIMGSSTLLPVLDALPLRRLSICLDRLVPFGIDKTDFSRPLFAQLTHLDILDWRDEGWPTWSGLAQLTQLTHLSFSYHDFIPYKTCHHVLRHCEALEVLAVVCSDQQLLCRFREQQRDLASDIRFIIVMVLDDLLDWEIGARGGDDYWSVADAVVKERWSTKDHPPRGQEEEDAGWS